MRLAFVLPFVLLGCGSSSGDPDAAITSDAEIPDAMRPDADPDNPGTLAETGLYSDPANETLAPGVRPYAPEYILWSDSATKRRWVYLPDSTTIDTTDMDYWVYPVGTKLWKEFTRGTTRVETRLLWKQADNQWFMRAYKWNEEQTEAVAVEAGEENVLGTDHDIPSRNQCEKCHERMPDISLGFTAIQLDHDPGDSSFVTLDTLVQESRLTMNPRGNAPYYDVPGRSANEVAAFGYLHANCGGCHHPGSDVMDTVDIDLKLDVDAISDPTQTSIYLTTVGVATNLTPIDTGVDNIIEPGDPDHSALYRRMNIRGVIQMPPLGTEDIDTDAVTLIQTWINEIPSL